MNVYEQLINEACMENIIVVEKQFKSSAKGLCKGNKIGISTSLKTIKEKRCILAEEIAHCKLTVGNILNQTNTSNIKQEMIARRWAYEKLTGIVDLINAYESGVRDKFDLIEYLEITEEFLTEAIKYYRNKYGAFYEIDNYIIYFSPNFGILKMI